MSKKIVVITGSPRKDGNSFAMTDAFIRAAQAKGHTVTRFDAAMMKIGGCHACETCFKTGKACSFDDDFNLIAPAVLEADALVFTMPVYWYSIPSQIKVVIDKLYSLVVGGKDYAGKECALIACCEEADMTVLDAVVNLADYIEPTRSYPDVDEIRRLAQGSLFDTLCEALGRTMILTIRQGSVLHPDTLVTWNALILRSKAEKGEEK